MLKKNFAKIIIVLFYLFVVALFFYAPRIKEFFFVDSKEITIYAPYAVFDVEKFKEFEKQTGVRVRVTYFETDAELLAKFKVSRGEGYDLIFPSDFMVEILVKEGLLQPLDKLRIPYHRKVDNRLLVDNRLMNRFFDLRNVYSLPSCWTTFGIAYDKKQIDIGDNVGWEVIFDPEFIKKNGNYKVTMLNNPRETIFLAMVYLFGRVRNISDSDLKKVKDLLIKQKSFVESYTEAGAKYLLLSHVVPMAVLPAGRLKEMGNMKDYGFVIPREGSLIDIYNFAIPVTSKKASLAYKLINFMLSKEVSAHNFMLFDYNPPNREAYDLIDNKFSKNKAFFPDDETFNKLEVVNNEIPPEKLEKIWFSVKSS